MSGHEPQQQVSQPFGYTYIGDQQHTQSQSESHPPTGPPLLDNNETGLLRDFFDDPNNIDPSFLAIAQERQEQDPYSSASQQQWLLGGLQQQDHSPHTAPGSHQASPIQPFAPHQSPSEDVYAAARLLHSSHSPYQNGTMSQQSFVAPAHAPQAPMYSYAQASQDNFNGQGQASGQASSSNSNMYTGLVPSGQSIPARRPTPLNFGSDSKFRETKYAAPKMQKPPDQDLMDIFSTFSHEPVDSPTTPHNMPVGQHRRKRRRSSAPNEDVEDSDEESSAKRGKLSARSEEHTESENTSNTKFNRRPVPRAKFVPSPGQRRRASPPGGRKPARENLTEEQKRSNHIQSEQKRRNLIKMGFEDTNHMVPELRAGGFSKSNMLQEAAKFMRELKSGNDRLAAMLGLLDKG